MSTYKVGNKVKGVIRAYTSGKIGSANMRYNNQPYTIIDGASVQLKFSDFEKTATTAFKAAYYNDSKVTRVDISNVRLNDKILNLIFSKSEIKLFTKVDNLYSDNKKLYISAPAAKIYQVFIYNEQQELVKAFGELTNLVVDVPADGEYLICYQYEGDVGYSLDRNDNQYFTLDLIVVGNEDEVTKGMTIHIEKCGLKIDKDMYFNNNSNAVDLSFVVLDTGEDYIVLK